VGSDDAVAVGEDAAVQRGLLILAAVAAAAVWSLWLTNAPGMTPPLAVESPSERAAARVGTPARQPDVAADPAGNADAARTPVVARPLAEQFSLRVVDAFEVGVAAALVEWQPKSRAAAPAELRTDANGWLRFDSDADELHVRASHPGYGRSVGRPWRRGEALLLHLLQPVAVIARVIDTEARPMPGAAVTVTETWSNAGAEPDRTARHVAVADAAGFAHFEVIAGSAMTAQVDEVRGSGSIAATATEPTELLLACRGAFRIEGVVVDRAGAPVAAAVHLSLLAMSAGGFPMQGWGGQHAESAADGRFRIELERGGAFHLKAVGEGICSMSVPAEVTATSPRCWVSLVAVPTRVTRGSVVDADGTALPSWPVVAEPVDAEFGREWALSGRGGAFELTLAAATKWRLRVDADDAPVVMADAGDDQLRLQVIAKAKEDADIAGPTVHVVRSDGEPPGYLWQQRLEIGSDGYRRSDLRQPGSGEHARICQMDADSGESAWYPADIQPPRPLRLHPPAALTVNVRTSHGSARAVSVVLDPCGAEQFERVDADGVARFRAPVGPAFVRVHRGPLCIATATIEIVPGHSTSLEVLIAP
jgi:hypothetical protein